MKTCEQFGEYLPALAEDVLAPAPAEKVRAHLETCPDCAESWKVQELITRHFRETELADKPDYYWARQRKHILEEAGFSTVQVAAASAWPRRIVKFAATAAAALLLFVGGSALVKKIRAMTPALESIADEPKKKPVKDAQVADNSVPQMPDPGTPEDPPKQDEKLADKPPVGPGPDAPPKEKDGDPVAKEPDPKPQPNPEGDKDKPKDDIVQKPNEPKRPNDTVPADPKDPPVDPKPGELVILPGHPKYPGRLAQEQVDILAPIDEFKNPVVKDRDTPEQGMALVKMARARLDDIRAMQINDPKADVTEMVDAYAHLMGEGVGPMLARFNQSSRPWGPIKGELRAQTALLDSFPEDFKKGTLAPAIQACAAASFPKYRRHTSRPGKGALAGAKTAALESVNMIQSLEKGMENLTVRARWGLAGSTRHQFDMLDHLRGGRVPEAEGEYEAYQKLIDGVLRMLEWVDPKDAARVCAAVRRDLVDYAGRFSQFPSTASTKTLLQGALNWTMGQLQKVIQIEGQLTGKTPRPDKKDPPPPKKDPPPQPPPKGDPPPGFGEPAPPPPPPPKGEGFDDPK